MYTRADAREGGETRDSEARAETTEDSRHLHVHVRVPKPHLVSESAHFIYLFKVHVARGADSEGACRGPKVSAGALSRSPRPLYAARLARRAPLEIATKPVLIGVTDRRAPQLLHCMK